MESHSKQSVSWATRIKKLFQLTSDDWGELGDSFDVSEDIMSFGNIARSKTRKNGILFDTFTDKDIENYIDTFTSPLNPTGMTLREQLRKKGLDNIIIEIDTEDAFVHQLNIYFECKDNEHLIAQLFGKRSQQYSVLDSKTLQQHSCSQNYQPLLPILEKSKAAPTVETISSSLSKLSISPPVSSPPFELWCVIPNSIAKKGKDCITKLLGKKSLSLTIIDWLRLQDPRGNFTKPQLPGQIKPGLGMARDVECLLYFIAQRHKRDGLMNSPEHWYNAYLYSVADYKFMFLNPAYEGWFRLLIASLTKEIAEKGLSAVAWAVAKGLIVYSPEPGTSLEQEKVIPEIQHSESKLDLLFSFFSKKKPEVSKTLTPIDAFPFSCSLAENFRKQYNGRDVEYNLSWSSQEQICAVSPRMSSYFKSPEYVSVLEECMAVKGSFRIRWE